MRKMKRFVKVILTICLLLCVTTLSAYASNTDWNLTTNAENNASGTCSPVNYIGTLDEDEELIAASHAVALALNEGDAIVFAGTGAYHDDAVQYVWTSMDDTYVAEPMQDLGSMNMIVFTATNGGTDASALAANGTYENEKSTIVYMSPEGESGELYTSEVVSVALDSVDDYPVVQLEGVPSDIYLPAAVINDDGYCTGIVYDSNYMLSLLTTEETFYGTSDSGNGGSSGNGGGSGSGSGSRSNGSSTATKDNSTYIIIGVVVVVLVVIIAVFSKKKTAAAQPTPQPMPQPVPQPMSQPMPQAIPQPMPQQMPQAEPVIRPQAQMSHLYAVGGVMNGRLYPLADEILIGRDVSCAVRFPADAKGVSRIHCKLFWQNGTLMLMDMNSSYGTFTISGKLSPMKPVPVKAGDIFYIAEKNNQFKIQ